MNAHVGSSAFLSVPAMHAAERRILNSKPSLETRVTYSVASGIVAGVGGRWAGEGVVRVGVGVGVGVGGGG